jgi:hypothetical protein
MTQDQFDLVLIRMMELDHCSEDVDSLEQALMYCDSALIRFDAATQAFSNGLDWDRLEIKALERKIMLLEQNNMTAPYFEQVGINKRSGKIMTISGAAVIAGSVMIKPIDKNPIPVLTGSIIGTGLLVAGIWLWTEAIDDEKTKPD